MKTIRGKPARRAENSAKTAQRGKPFETGNAYAFQPGESGNPGGRPKGHDFLRDMIQELAAQKASPRAKSIRLVALLNKMFSSRDARDHANILEHGYGKVPQTVDVTADVNLLTPEQQEAKRAERWARVAPALAGVLSESGGE